MTDLLIFAAISLTGLLALICFEVFVESRRHRAGRRAVDEYNRSVRHGVANGRKDQETGPSA